MAKLTLNPILDRLSGAIGDLVFRRYGGEVIVARKPDRTGAEWTPAQLAVREHFRQAVLYAKAALADPEARAFYEAVAAARNKPIFSQAVADYLNSPSIKQIDLDGYEGHVGDEIIVTASDDLSVTDVTVRVADDGDYFIEAGPAVETPAGSGRWVYQAQTEVSEVAVQIMATATDRPGGIAKDYAEKLI